jgi:hypothetical protein
MSLLEAHNQKLLQDGDWFKYDDVIYVVNRAFDLLAFGVNGHHVMSEHVAVDTPLNMVYMYDKVNITLA